MIIFKALIADQLDALKAEGVRILVEGYSRIKNCSPQVLEAYMLEHFNSMVNKAWGSEHEIFLAVHDADNDQWVGCLWYRLPQDEMFSEMAFINWFGIFSPYQRRGYGKAAMEALKTRLKSQGRERLVLEVFQANAQALSFYQCMGFAPTRLVMQSDL